MPPKGGLVLKDACTDMASYNTWTRYGQSKLANVLFTKQLACRYPFLKATAVHPSGIYTGLPAGFEQEHYLAMMLPPVGLPLLKTVQDGALTQLFAATSEWQLLCFRLKGGSRIQVCSEPKSWCRALGLE